MRQYLPDLSKPIDKAKGPRTRTGYYRVLENGLFAVRPQGDGIGGYLNARGDELNEGSNVRLRVTPVHEIRDPNAWRSRYVADHHGWYADEYQSQLIYGIVARLPSGRGFLAGWTMGAGMCASLDTRTVWDDEIKAARDADRQAQYAAEDEREYQEKSNAAAELESLRERICELKREHTALIRAIWSGERDDAIGARLRANCRAAVAEAREQIQALVDAHGDLSEY